MQRQAFLTCGLLASILYVGIDFAAAIAYPEYHSFSARMVSELMAAGSPTERLVDPLFLLYDVLMVAFAYGLWLDARVARLRTLAKILGLYGVFGALGPTLFEMDVRRANGALSTADVVHILATLGIVILIFAAVAVGAGTFGRTFRRYSYLTIAVMFLIGGLSAAAASTSWIGVVERINIGAFLLWIAVLALGLRSPRTDGHTP